MGKTVCLPPMISPCRTCPNQKQDKNKPACTNCMKRVNFARQMDYEDISKPVMLPTITPKGAKVPDIMDNIIATCTKCGQKKPITDFYKNQNRPGGYDTICKPCKATKSQQERDKKKAKAIQQDNSDLTSNRSMPVPDSPCPSVPVHDNPCPSVPVHNTPCPSLSVDPVQDHIPQPYPTTQEHLDPKPTQPPGYRSQTIAIRQDIYDDISKIAATDFRTIDLQINFALKMYLDSYTLEATRDQLD